MLSHFLLYFSSQLLTVITYFTDIVVSIRLCFALKIVFAGVQPIAPCRDWVGSLSYQEIPPRPIRDLPREVSHAWMSYQLGEYSVQISSIHVVIHFSSYLKSFATAVVSGLSFQSGPQSSILPSWHQTNRARSQHRIDPV